MKRLSVLGSTGSVGASTLDLVRHHPDRFSVEALVCGRDWELLAKLAKEFQPSIVVVADETARSELASQLSGSGIEVASGPSAILEAAARPADLVVAAIVGAAGLAPILAALEAGTTVALANKEALVCAGSLMVDAAEYSGAKILPIDSEHNAIFQVLEERERIRRIILTASGGPFRNSSRAAMEHVTPAEAIRHPTWSMGAKISVDSATLMNKGLELIEAHYLFRVGADQLDVLIHPQSLVHGLVEYIDGSFLAQMGTADMRIPIAHALAWPERIATPAERLDLARVGRLEFEEPDRVRFPALALAESALAAGGCRPPTLNAANEVAVEAFLQGKIGFLDIASLVEETLDAVSARPLSSLEDVTAVDAEARSVAGTFVDKFAVRRRAG